MCGWKSITSVSEREEYNHVLSSTNKAYTRANMKGLNKLLDERQGRAFIYTEETPKKFQIAMMVTPAFGQTGGWKIVNGTPVGDYEPEAALKILFTKIREVMDEEGISSFFGLPLKDYEDEKINAYFRSIPKLIWECSAKEEASETKDRYVFNRDPARKNEDLLFQGRNALSD